MEGRSVCPYGRLRTESTHSHLSLIHISEPTRLLSISYAVFCLKKKKKKKNKKKKKKKKKKRKEKKEKYYVLWCVFFFLMIRRPQRSTRKESSAASDVYKRQVRARKDAGSGVRRILEADLWEISVVTFPMLPDARVTAVKGCLLYTSPSPRDS